MEGAYDQDYASKGSSTLMEVNLTSSRLLVPDYHMASVLSMLSSLQAIEGYGSTEQAKPLTFDVKVAKPFVTQPVTEREKELQKELDDKNNSWYKYYQENEKLKKELRDLKTPQQAPEVRDEPF